MSDAPLVWKGEDAFCPRCSMEVTTSMMAAICPHREKCEFWPDDKASQDFLDGMGIRYSRSIIGSATP